MANIFVSYAHRDGARFVQPFVRAVREHHDVWYDAQSIAVTESIPLRISEGLNRSEVAVLVISPAYLESSWCKRELGALVMAHVNAAKRLLVVRVDGAPIPPIISDILYTEVTDDASIGPCIDTIVGYLDANGARPSAAAPAKDESRVDELVHLLLDANRHGRFGGNLLPRDATRPENEGLILIKPGGTFVEECLREILRRISARCRIRQLRLFDGGLIAGRELFEQQYATPSRLAEGKIPLTERDVERIRRIYANDEFAAVHGVPYSDDLVVPALKLTKEQGLDPRELTELWERGRDEGLFHNNRPDGLNKIAYQKSVFPIDVPGLGVRIVLNGFIPGYRQLFVDDDARVVAVHAATTDSWQTIRDDVVGGVSDPRACRLGSIRRDAAHGLIPLDPGDAVVNGQRNVCHSSATLFDGMRELHLWFEHPYADTVIGQVATLQGVDPVSLIDLTLNELPDFSWHGRDEGLTSILFDVQLRVAREQLRSDVDFDERIADISAELDGSRGLAERLAANPSLRAFVEEGLRLTAGGDWLYQQAIARGLADERRAVFVEAARRIQRLADDAGDRKYPEVVAAAYRIAAGDLMLLGCPAYDRVASPELFRASVVAPLAEAALECARRTRSNFVRDLGGLYAAVEPAEGATSIGGHPAWAEVLREQRRVATAAPLVAVILAGGRSTRMASTIPKPVLPLGRSMLLTCVEDTVRSTRPDADVFAAVGFRADLVEKAIGARLRYIWDARTLGLAFRAAAALEALSDYEGPVLLTYADMPRISGRTIEELLRAVSNERTFALVESAAELSGHIVREDRQVVRVVQSRFERPPRSENMRDVGMYAFNNTPEFREALGSVRNANPRGEFMFADVVEVLARRDWRIATVSERPELARGINTSADLLALATGVARRGGAPELGAACASLAEEYGLHVDAIDTFSALRSAIVGHHGPIGFFHWWEDVWS